MSRYRDNDPPFILMLFITIILIVLVILLQSHWENVHKGHAIIKTHRNSYCLTCEPDRISNGWKVVQEEEKR